MNGYIVMRDKTFYDFKQKTFVEKWTKDCQSPNREDIKEFIGIDDYRIMSMPLGIKGFGLLEDFIELEENK